MSFYDPIVQKWTGWGRCKFNAPFPQIIQEKVRPAKNRDVSTRGLLTLLSLLSLAEAEAEPEALNPRLYQTKFQENTRTSSVSAKVTEKPYFDTVDVVIGGITHQTNPSRYQGRPQRQFDIPPVRLSGRSGGVGGVGGVETVTSPPSYYPQSVSWAPPPPQELPTDRAEILEESPEKVRALECSSNINCTF